jgi:hypothetical protein
MSQPFTTLTDVQAELGKLAAVHDEADQAHAAAAAAAAANRPANGEAWEDESVER